MAQTNTEITWPSKLKIGAKSKKGEVVSVHTIDIVLHLICNLHASFSPFSLFPIFCGRLHITIRNTAARSSPVHRSV